MFWILAVCAFLEIIFPSVLLAEGGGGGTRAQPHATVTEPFIYLGPINITIIKDGEAKGYIRLSLNLEAPDKETWEHVTHIAPRIQNDLVVELSSILCEFWLAGSEPHLDNIRDVLQLIVNKSLGSDKVKAVLMQSYFYARANPSKA